MPLGSTLALLFRIDADSSDAVEKLRALEEEFKKLAAQNFDAVKKGLADLGALIKEKFSAASDIFHEFTSSMTGALGPVGKLLDTLGPLGSAFAAVAGAMQLMIHSAVELGSQLHDLSIVTGFSVEQLAQLRVVAATADTDIQSLSQAVVRFQRNVETSEKAQAALGAFGLTVQEVERDGVAAFTKLAKNMDSVGSTAQRNALLMAVMGRSAAQQIPLLDELAQQADTLAERTRRLGLAFDPDFANKADKLGDNLAIVKLQLQAVGQAFAGPFLKAMNDSTEASQEFNGALIKTSGYLGKVLGFISASVNPFTQFRRVVDGATEAYNDFLFAIGKQNLPGGPTQLTKDALDKFIESGKTALPKGAIPDDQISKILKEQGEDKQRRELNKFKCFALGDCADYLKDIGYKKPPKGKKPPEDISVTEFQLAETRDAQEKINRSADDQIQRQKDLAEDRQGIHDAEVAETIQFSNLLKDVYQSQVRIVEQRRDKEIAIENERLKKLNESFDKEEELTKKNVTLKREQELALREIDKKRNEAERANSENIKKIETDALDSLDETIRKLKELSDTIKGVKLTADTTAQQQFPGKGTIVDPAVDAANQRQLDAQHNQNENLKELGESYVSVAERIGLMNQQLVEQVALAIQQGNAFSKMQGALSGFGTAIKGIFGSGATYLAAFSQAFLSITRTIVETGKTGPAVLKQLVQGVLKGIAEMALWWSEYFFSLAIGLAVLGDWGGAASMTLAAIGLAAVAAALGFAAAAVGPKSGNAAGTAATGSAQPPQTTINLSGVGALASTPGQAFSALSGSINALNDKLGSMSPGDVVTVAAKTSPNAFANGVTNATRSNASFSRQLGLTLLPST